MMLKQYPAQAAIILISSVMAIASSACSSDKPSSNSLDEIHSTSRRSNIVLETTPPKPAPPPQEQPNQFELALDKAAAAYTISQSAQSADDWNLVVGKWQEAIALMQTVSTNSRDKSIAQKKIAEYQRNRNYARQQAKISASHTNLDRTTAALPPIDIPVNSSANSSIEFLSPPLADKSAFQVPVKRRESGTPVIDVTFNGIQQFEMIVDTGASSTVITQEIATALGVVPVATAKANTASDRGVEFPIGYVESIAVGAAVLNDVPVAIAASPQLQTGLLGHDFFNNYDITFKRDVIIFHPR